MKNADALRRSRVFALILLGFFVLFENPAAAADVALAWSANVERVGDRIELCGNCDGSGANATGGGGGGGGGCFIRTAAPW